MSNTHWLVIGVVVVVFAVYWFKFRKKGAHLMHTKTGPQVVKKGGKKGWRHRLSKVGGNLAKMGDAATGGYGAKAMGTAGAIGLV